MNLAEIYAEAMKAKEMIASLKAGIRDLYTVSSPAGVRTEVLYPVAKALREKGWTLERKRRVGHITYGGETFYLSPLELSHTIEQAEAGEVSQTDPTPTPETE